MKKKTLKKLTLSKESIRCLEQGELAEVQGGDKTTQLNSNCHTCGSCFRTCTC